QSPFGMGGYMGPAQFAPGMSGGFYPMGGFQNAGMNGMMMNSPFMMNGMQQMNNPFMMNGMQQNPMMAGQFNSPMAMGNGFNGLQVNTGFNMMR
ncbi:MAG: hypothetical protein EBS53_18100, partial [Bacteroidetes bacterium]|nr:hypothetical protein [Bacteroidota bacterium]